ncbi:hypothetical protein [Synechococcus sp. A15-60]
MKAFWEAIQSDPTLQQKLQASPTPTPLWTLPRRQASQCLQKR